jgi:hypothetical protein
LPDKILLFLVVLVSQLLVLVNVDITTVLSETRKSTALDVVYTPRMEKSSKTMQQLTTIWLKKPLHPWVDSHTMATSTRTL